MREFENRVAVVTGTTGIARATAKRLASGGCKVFACGIDAAANKELQQEAQRDGLDVRVEQCDVSQPEQVKAIVAKAVATHGRLDIIVNAAAILPYGTAVTTDVETWNRCMAINVGGIFLFAHFGIPEMKKSGGGAIVNLASVQGYACQRDVVAYATSKGAVHSMTRALALDHAADRIRVNSISPGSIRTPMLAHSAAYYGPDLPVETVFERFGAAHPLGASARPKKLPSLPRFSAPTARRSARAAII